MSLATIIKMQTAFTTIEHQTGSRELAAMFDLFLIEGEDQRKLIFVGDNKRHVETVRLALGSYAGAYENNLEINFMHKLLRAAIAEHADMVKYAKDNGDLQEPKFDLVVEVTLTT